jgi:hypothetical protein
VEAGGDVILGNGQAIYTEGLPDTSIINGFSSLVPNFTVNQEFYARAGGRHLMSTP